MACQNLAMATLKRSPRRWRLYFNEWRESRGLKQEQVAERLGVDFQTISRWERFGDGRSDERKPDPDDIAALAEVYDCEPEDFYHHPGEPTPNALLRDQSPEIREQAMRVINAIRKPN